jgi:hypothetical protein
MGIFFRGFRADLNREGPIRLDGTGGLQFLPLGQDVVVPEGATSIHIGALCADPPVKAGDVVRFVAPGNLSVHPEWMHNGKPGSGSGWVA